VKFCIRQEVWLKLFLCLATSGGSLTGFAQLKADFTMDPPNGDCSPLSENFFNITSGASSTYEWDFGNNSNKGMIKVRAKAHIPVQYCGLMSL